MATLQPQDYRHEGESSALLQGLLIPLVILGVPALIGFGFEGLSYKVAAVIGGWTLVGFMVIGQVLSYQHKRLSLQGLQTRVLGSNFPEIRQTLNRLCHQLGIPEPTAYVVAEEEQGIRLRGFQRPFLVISETVRRILSPAEFESLLAHELGHLHARHLFWRSVVLTAREMHPLLRLPALPILLLKFFLERPWIDLIEITADRVALLLLRDHTVCSAAILKLEAVRNPLSNVTPQDVDGYLRKESLGTSAEDVEARFRMGTLIRSNPELFERIEDLLRFSQSETYRRSLQKLQAASAS